MKEQNKQPLFKAGIWIKEQQGELTVGSLGDDTQAMVIPESLSEKIFEFENDMIQALYGEDRVSFDPAKIDVDRLFRNLKKEFEQVKLRISFSDSQGSSLKGSFDDIYHLLKQFVLSALPDDGTISDDQIIYINASLLENHLCMIFRDSSFVSNPKRLKKEISFIKKQLGGEVSFKSTGTQKTYYDIMIPSKE